MSNNEMTKRDRDAVLGHLYDMLFQAWPLMRRRLLPSPAQQAGFGMPLSHVQVLAMLDHRGSLSISEISNSFGIAKPNITPLVDRLIEEGLVMRERNNADRRVVNVVICEEGRKRRFTANCATICSTGRARWVKKTCTTSTRRWKPSCAF